MAGPDRFAEAKSAHDEAIRLDPNNPAMWFGRLIMLEKNRRFHEAIEDADVILRLPADLITKPRAAESYLKSTTHRIATAIKWGEMLRKLGRTNEAWQAYNMAAELDPYLITHTPGVPNSGCRRLVFFQGCHRHPWMPFRPILIKRLHSILIIG